VLAGERLHLIAGGDAGDPVEHVGARPLLSHDDWTDPRLFGGVVVEEGIAREPNHMLYTFLSQDFCNGFCYVHPIAMQLPPGL